jgi:SAM-dependent methyltransferase
LVNGKAFPLFDLSMNGVSFLSPVSDDAWEIGESLELSLMLHGEEVYRGIARVARTERGPRGARIGLGLSTGFLDLPEILRRDDDKRLERDLRQGPGAISRLVPSSYKNSVSEIVYFLQFYRKSLDEHDLRFRHSLHSGNALQALSEQAYQAVCKPWQELQVLAAATALGCLDDRDVLLAAKEYTEVLVTPLLMRAPFVKRAYEKPLGYPGDFQMMQFCYSNEYEGDTSFGRAIHKYYVGDYPLSRGVRARKDLMVELMAKEHGRAIELGGDTANFHVVSLGCGPAREVSDYIAQQRGWPGQVVWTLIDQEESALSVAYQASKREIGKHQSNGHLNLLNLSFVQLLGEGLPLQASATQDFIFSVGLFDYLRESRAKSLLMGLFELLAPGGLMAIGNARAPNSFFWAAEFVADWTLFYRTESEMIELAALLPESAELSVISDRSGAYYFLLVRKH